MPNIFTKKAEKYKKKARFLAFQLKNEHFSLLTDYIISFKSAMGNVVFAAISSYDFPISRKVLA